MGYLMEQLGQIIAPLNEAAPPDVRTLDWFKFERLVTLLFEHEGFHVERYCDSNSDGGIDFAATKQGVTFGVKCKHWQASHVDVDGVNAFLAALRDRNMRNGFIVTLAGYTEEAIEHGRRTGIDLMDEPMLLENLEAVKWRFNSAFVSLWGDDVKTCPQCEAPTVLRVALKDEYGGRRIWGCSAFPNCTFKLALN
jgi:hypothetical protein